MSVTLEQLLESRDNRAQHQKDLLGKNPGKSLLCLTVQLPGSVKRSADSLAIAQAGVEAIRQAFSPEYEELKDLETGYEAFFLVSMPPLEAKRKTCQIEDSHPLGRLMDIDVLTVIPGTDCASAGAHGIGKNIFRDGTRKTIFPEAIANPTHADAVPVGREEIGLPQRRCLLCGAPVRVCMRARTHSSAELLDKIHEMVKIYLNL